MLEKMVLATDLSADWDLIVGCGAELRALGASQAILTHVIVTKGLVGAEESARAAARPRLEEQKSQLESQGFEVVVETPIGLPAFSLNEVAQKHCASLIVLGSHGKSAWREAVLGSVSAAVLHNARFPTLLVNVDRLMEGGREGSCQLRTSELLRHVLFPTDFSEVAAGAAEYLKYLVPKGLSEVTVLHVLETTYISPWSVLKQPENAGQSEIEAVVKDMEISGVPQVRGRIFKGHPVPKIMECLTTGDYSLVVMGTQGKGLVSELFLGSVAYNIARLAPCPVLLIPRMA
ncbi:universal stress protein [Desulfoferrobacter suflitae]|uniref:universal stress protein n=1 Tax=Desulfoferrobacter suflitae TaxID=2865782 RepID=UPI002164254E|nr:universal stress protein [Desulfoferrobacter suflitae]MCK8603170.1 universal stress protein [Desulfoferrobacter suflitae]